MLLGINHVTFAVTDLDRSVGFYTDILGCELHARWDSGAYLTVGNFWLCLSLDSDAVPAAGYSHIAFSIDAESFADFRSALMERQVRTWKQNFSEGDSLYFLDPDGHRLEAHVGDLESRLKAIRAEPYSGLCINTDL